MFQIIIHKFSIVQQMFTVLLLINLMDGIMEG